MMLVQWNLDNSNFKGITETSSYLIIRDSEVRVTEGKNYWLRVIEPTLQINFSFSCLHHIDFVSFLHSMFYIFIIKYRIVGIYVHTGWYRTILSLIDWKKALRHRKGGVMS